MTIVLGKNNSGKSALVRAPLVFATAFQGQTSAPLDLERLDVEPVDAFTDLVFEHNVHGRIGVELEVDGDSYPSFRLTSTVQHLSETLDAFVSDLTVEVLGARVQMQWVPELWSAGLPRVYEVRVNDRPPRQMQVRFRGLVPVTAPAPELRQWVDSRPSLGPIRYLSPYRERLRRQHRLPLGPPQALGAQGQGVSAVLADDKARGDGEVIGMVNSYLETVVPDWQLEEVPVGPLWATVLVRRSDGGARVNLADAGAGLAQVLPILVQCAMDERTGGQANAVQIIEEPEMHLHPAVHADLADLYLRTATATGIRFLIETHSETLLLRLRRRIAEGDYPPDTVRVYVVDQRDGISSAREVEIDRLGNLSQEWPEGYFSTDYEDVRALAAAQLRRSQHAA